MRAVPAAGTSCGGGEWGRGQPLCWVLTWAAQEGSPPLQLPGLPLTSVSMQPLPHPTNPSPNHHPTAPQGKRTAAQRRAGHPRLHRLGLRKLQVASAAGRVSHPQRGVPRRFQRQRDRDIPGAPLLCVALGASGSAAGTVLCTLLAGALFHNLCSSPACSGARTHGPLPHASRPRANHIGARTCERHRQVHLSAGGRGGLVLDHLAGSRSMRSRWSAQGCTAGTEVVPQVHAVRAALAPSSPSAPKWLLMSTLNRQGLDIRSVMDLLFCRRASAGGCHPHPLKWHAAHSVAAGSCCGGGCGGNAPSSAVRCSGRMAAQAQASWQVGRLRKCIEVVDALKQSQCAPGPALCDACFSCRIGSLASL